MRVTDLDGVGGVAVLDDERRGGCEPDSREPPEVIAAGEDAHLPDLRVGQNRQRVLLAPPADSADAFEPHLVGIPVLVHLVQDALASEDHEVGVLAAASSGQPQRPG